MKRRIGERVRHWRARVEAWPPLWRRIAGFALVLGGLVGFLPVAGFWMLPLGLVVLSIDFPVLRRWGRGLRRAWRGRQG